MVYVHIGRWVTVLSRGIMSGLSIFWDVDDSAK